MDEPSRSPVFSVVLYSTVKEARAAAEQLKGHRVWIGAAIVDLGSEPAPRTAGKPPASPS